MAQMRRPPTLFLIAVLALAAAIGACAPAAIAQPDWRTDPSEPYPFVTPLPPVAATALDGLYDREPTDTFEGDWAECRRCPPYFVDRGRSELTFRLGRWTNTHMQPHQLTNGHFTLEGDRLIIINDPMCPFDRGQYRYTLTNGVLTLTVVNDPCAFGERTRDLTELAWHRLGDAPTPAAPGTPSPRPSSTSAEYRSQ